MPEITEHEYYDSETDLIVSIWRDKRYEKLWRWNLMDGLFTGPEGDANSTCGLISQGVASDLQHARSLCSAQLEVLKLADWRELRS